MDEGESEDRPHPRFARGRLLLDNGRFADAAAALSDAAELTETSGARGECWYWAGVAYAQSGDRARAVIAFESAERGFVSAGRVNDAARTHSYRGDLAASVGELVPAHVHFDRASELYGAEEVDARFRCWYMMGRLHNDLGNAAAAERELKVALGLVVTIGDPERIGECEDALATALTGAGRLDEALRMLEAAVSHYPAERAQHRADCLNRAGLILAGQGKGAAAEAMWGRAQGEYAAAGRADSGFVIALERGRTLFDLARLDDALVQYRAAYAAAQKAGHPDEMAWCEAHIAAVHLNRGELEAARGLLVRANAVLAEGNREHYLTGRYFLARVHLEHGDTRGARGLLGETLSEARARGLAELAVDCSMTLAQAMIREGDYRGVLELLDEPRRILKQLGRWPKIAVCQSLRGTCHVGLGEFRAAEETLLDARATLLRHGNPRQLAETECALGMVYLHTGRFPEAETMLDRAIASLRALGAAAVSLAVVEFNLANVYLRQTRYTEAVRMLTAAEAVFRAAGQNDHATACRHTLGMIRMNSGVGDGVIETLESTLDGSRPGPVSPRAVATKTFNLAVAHANRGDTGQALTCTARARGLYSDLNDLMGLATCDLFAAVCLADRAPHDQRRLLDLALPAAIYIDHQRLQFLHADARVAWSGSHPARRSNLFEWLHALRDPTLMAEFIEVAINSGTHVAHHEDSPARLDFLDALASDPAASDATDLYAAAELPSSAGAGILLAGTALPMRPPPRLRLPDGRVALAAHIDGAISRYGPIGRAGEVRTW